MVEFVASVPKQPTSNVDATRSLPGTIPVASARPGWCRSGFPGPFLVVARALPPPWDVRWRGSVGSGNSPEFLLQKPGRSGTGSTGGDGLQLHRMDRRRGEGGRWGPASARLASARLALRLGLGLAEWERRMGVRRRRVRIRGRVSPTTKNKVTLGASGMGTGLEMRMALAVEIKKKREGQEHQFATTKGIKHCSGRVREACAASPNLLAAGLSGLGGTGHRVWPGQPGNILGVPACQDCCRPEKYGGAQAKPHPRIGFAPFSPIPIPVLHLGQSRLCCSPQTQTISTSKRNSPRHRPPTPDMLITEYTTSSFRGSTSHRSIWQRVTCIPRVTPSFPPTNRNSWRRWR